jgi:hypothetical protein
MGPRARKQVFDAYWRFAHERQQIFYRRARGESDPWTDDPILGQFKFCNAFRASDRVSQYLIRDVIYSDRGVDLAAEDVFLRIILFRFFSKESTWRVLEAATGGIGRRTLKPEILADVLDRQRREQPIYTAAFILAAHDVYGQGSKHRNHLMLVDEMFGPRRLGRDLARARSLEDVYEALIAWPMIGPFMAYQLAIDLNYSEHLEFSEDDFTMPGPGAERGLKKVFLDLGGNSPQQVIADMVKRQDEEFGRLSLTWDGLFGRPLHAIDCQGLFCEIDKYSREAFPQLRSNRIRIKQQFQPSPDPIPLFYPPKWGLKVPKGRSGSAGPGNNRPARVHAGDQLAIAAPDVEAK